MASTLDILRRLANHRVEFVLVGGMAGVAHGASQVTEDLDVCAPMTLENVSRIIQSLDGLHARLRMTSRTMPLPRDPALLSTYKNLYLLTDAGQVDLLGEITGVGTYDDVRHHSMEVRVAGTSCRVLDLPTLIRAKRAMGRGKDLHAAIELEAILQRIRNNRLGESGE